MTDTFIKKEAEVETLELEPKEGPEEEEISDVAGAPRSAPGWIFHLHDPDNVSGTEAAVLRSQPLPMR